MSVACIKMVFSSAVSISSDAPCPFVHSVIGTMKEERNNNQRDVLSLCWVFRLWSRLFVRMLNGKKSHPIQWFFLILAWLILLPTNLPIDIFLSYREKISGLTWPVFEEGCVALSSGDHALARLTEQKHCSDAERSHYIQTEESHNSHPRGSKSSRCST